MINATKPLILASGSPRRKELLALYGIPFEIDPAQGEENAQGAGCERVKLLARAKCEEVYARHPDRYVLAADTLVCLDGEIMGKPRDERDAERMLGELSGRTHQVYTGVCLCAPDGRMLLDVETTDVTFLTLSQASIRRYVATGEPMDKAGAYAIQGRAGVFISRISGSPSNVVGLPLGLLTRFFEQMEILVFD